MAVKVTRIGVEGAFAAPRYPKIKALPFALPGHVEANWDDPITVSTSYLADVTRAEDDLSEDRRALDSRPARTVEFSFLGHGLGAYKAALGSYQRSRTQTLVPLPCDYTKVTGAAIDLGGKHYIPCDTRWRRFFLQQHIHWVSGGEAEVGTIELLHKDAMVVTGLTSTPSAGDIIYPLMNCEAVLQTSMIAETDSVVTGSVSGLEIPGPTALPPTWTTGLDGIVTLADDGKPFFDFDANWGDGVPLAVTREGEIEQVGKGRASRISGVYPSFDYEWPILCRNREEFWRLLRWWDWAKGTTETFWVPSPVTVWKPTSVPVVSRLAITYDGDAADLDPEGPFSHVAIKAEGVDEWWVREVDSVLPGAPGSFSLVLTEDLPVQATILPLEDAVPVSLCRNAVTTLSESWITDKVCEISPIKFQRVFEEKSVALSDLNVNYLPTLAPDEITGIQFWFSSTKNCYQDKGRFYELCGQGTFNRDTDVLLDVRNDSAVELEESTQLQRQEFPHWLRTTAIYPSLTLSSTLRWQHYGAPFLLNPTCTFGGHNAGPWTMQHVPVRDRTMWDNTNGWTLFVAFVGGNQVAVGPEVNIMQVRSNTSQGLFRWVGRGDSTGGGMRFEFYNSPGVLNPSHVIRCPHTEQATPIVVMVRWTPGAQAYVYFNGTSTDFGTWAGGTNPWTTASTLSAIGIPSEYQADDWLAAFDHQTQISPARPEASVMEDHWANLSTWGDMCSFKRALTDGEANLVGGYFASKIGAVWEDL